MRLRVRPAWRRQPAGMWLLPAAAFLCVTTTTAATTTTTTAAASAGLCVAGYHSCAVLGASFADLCCPLVQSCMLDEADEPACCPAGYACTGTAPAAATTASLSYVPDYYYGYFPYVVPAGAAASTALADIGSCDAAVQQCRANFALCTTVLGGAMVTTDTTAATAATAAATATTPTTTPTFGVTVVVSSQTTIQLHKRAAATISALVLTVPTTLAAASAASICSLLSSQACGGLPASCSVLFATKTATVSASSSTRSSTISSAGRNAQLAPLHRHVALLAATVAVVVLVL
ncbi:hypothetical protein CMQ_3422 [Grosmannia clavigera kw1407]|uniref:Uncharacterized protein n=1 Tax=Grosmannia clavigera (strain kw1407 / UAMH 11150) TaxID=655863 RepID=F0X930_GROCL|nr:uncharacterized protein CMQ_3422 [Grosmannia clavigera kw1407]EFX05353.1 hypothetical protein CMQ_3422 [Grosmannia clavigera kw1407]